MDVAKVNLNTSAYDIPGARAIHPSELLYNNGSLSNRTDESDI
ncbi:cell wall hydrolase [Lactococcus sp. LG1267]|nr:cell wall hydrolase [Lactococcus sp. LG1267]